MIWGRPFDWGFLIGLFAGLAAGHIHQRTEGVPLPVSGCLVLIIGVIVLDVLWELLHRRPRSGGQP